MNLATEFSSFINAGSPDRRTTDPSKKTPAWIRQMAAAGLTEFNRSQAHWPMWAHDNNIAENLQYAQGVQDVRQYIRTRASTSGYSADSLEVTNRDGYHDEDGEYVRSPRGAGRDLAASDPTALDSIINADPLPILPVKLRGLKATIMSAGYEATITALGKKAENDVAEYAALVRQWMDLGKNYEEMGIPKPEQLPDPMPQTEQEYRNYLDDYQVEAAADLERKLLVCAIESGLDELMEEVGDDLLTHGYGCLVDEQKPGQRPLGRRILPSLGLFLPSSYPDYRDRDEGGYLEYLSYDDLLTECQDNKLTCNADGQPWEDDDRAAIKGIAATAMPEGMRMTGAGLEAVGTGTLLVVRWKLRTNDMERWKTKQDDSGNVRTKRIRDPKYVLTGKGSLTEVPINTLYECTLVAGTGLAYGCRKVLDQGRDLHNPLKARLPFSLFSVAVNGKPVSIVRNAKGIVDEIERSWRAYMAIKRTYTPSGSNIPPDLLTAMATAMKFQDEDAAYSFIKQTGDSFFPRNDNDHPGQPIVNPITTNPFGIPEEAVKHLSDVFQQLQLLEMVTGANAVVSATTPTVEQGKGVNQIALQGAANVMLFLRNGLKRMYENHSRNIAGRIWLTEHETPITGVVTGGSGRKVAVGPRKDLHEYEFHMDVRFAPTTEEWTALYQRAGEASVNKQITVADEMQIHWLRNLKNAQRYLAMAVARKQRDDEASTARLQQQNGQVQAQTGQAAAAAQAETNDRDHKNKMEQLAFQRDTAWGTVERQTEAQTRIAAANNATRLDINDTTVSGKFGAQLAQHEHEHSAAIRDALLTPAPAPAGLPAAQPAAPAQMPPMPQLAAQSMPEAMMPPEAMPEPQPEDAMMPPQM